MDLFFQDRYLNAIQTNCPHILRYLVCPLITTMLIAVTDSSSNHKQETPQCFERPRQSVTTRNIHIS